jgi:hypothetical protein
MIKELDSVVLTTDLPEHGLAKDDIGTVVLVHEGGKGCTVEFMTLAGHTIAVSRCWRIRFGKLPKTKSPTPAMWLQHYETPLRQ